MTGGLFIFNGPWSPTPEQLTIWDWGIWLASKETKSKLEMCFLTISPFPTSV